MYTDPCTDQTRNSTQEPVTQLHVRKDVVKGQIIQIGSPIKMSNSSKACFFKQMIGVALHAFAILSAPRISLMTVTLKLADSKKTKVEGASSPECEGVTRCGWTPNDRRWRRIACLLAVLCMVIAVVIVYQQLHDVNQQEIGMQGNKTVPGVSFSHTVEVPVETTVEVPKSNFVEKNLTQVGTVYTCKAGYYSSTEGARY